MPIHLTSRADFTLANYLRVSWEGERVEFAESALARMAETRRQFLDLLDNDPEIHVYGVTSGYGKNAGLRLSPEQRREHARRLP
jgi:histidine ammonia-lyase